jgi:hypothetical protein
MRVIRDQMTLRRMMRSAILAMAAAYMSVSGPAQAHDIRSGDLVIVHPTVSEAVKNQASAQGSMEICNDGDSPDQLLTVNSEFAAQVKIFPTIVTIPARGRAKVAVLFQHIKNRLSEDEVYSGDLTFNNAALDVIHLHANKRILAHPINFLPERREAVDIPLITDVIRRYRVRLRVPGAGQPAEADSRQ